MAEDNMSNIINNFKNMLTNNHSSSNNASNSNSSNNSSSNNMDTSNNNSSNLNITPEMIGNLANILQSSSSDSKSSNSSANSNSSNTANGDDFSNNIDFETILKIKSIMETLNNKDDPRSNLLYSLKPYLRESKQKKIDQYVNLFKLTQVTNLFKNEKGAKS